MITFVIVLDFLKLAELPLDESNLETALFGFFLDDGNGEEKNETTSVRQ